MQHCKRQRRILSPKARQFFSLMPSPKRPNPIFEHTQLELTVVNACHHSPCGLFNCTSMCKCVQAGANPASPHTELAYVPPEEPTPPSIEKSLECTSVSIVSNTTSEIFLRGCYCGVVSMPRWLKGASSQSGILCLLLENSHLLCCV